MSLFRFFLANAIEPFWTPFLADSSNSYTTTHSKQHIDDVCIFKQTKTKIFSFSLFGRRNLFLLSSRFFTHSSPHSADAKHLKNGFLSYSDGLRTKIRKKRRKTKCLFTFSVGGIGLWCGECMSITHSHQFNAATWVCHSFGMLSVARVETSFAQSLVTRVCLCVWTQSKCCLDKIPVP